MSVRLYHLLAVVALALMPWHGRAAEEAASVPADAPAATSPAAEPASAAEEQVRMTGQGMEMTADSLTFDAATGVFQAAGHVALSGPQGTFTADTANVNRAQGSGFLENAGGMFGPLRFRAESMSIDANQTAQIHDALLTTCTKDHPHYGLHAKDFVVLPDKRFEARRVSLAVGRYRLFTIPRLRGDLNKNTTESIMPTVMPGISEIDGTYVGVNYARGIGSDTQMTLSTRYGTNRVLRGGLFVERPFALPNRPISGKVSLIATVREDVANLLTNTDQAEDERLENPTISRLPAVQVSLDPIALPGRLGNFRLQAGGGIGRYEEYNTGVTANRAQLWSILSTPTLALGPVRLHGEYGVRGAFYGSDSHATYAAQLTAETPIENENYYANVTLLHRRETGSTPFLFDRVLVPDELYTELELPITPDKRWRIGAWNRQELHRRFTSNDFGLTAFYREDCISYGLIYDNSTRTFGVGLALNAFNSFRRGASDIAFTQ